MYKLVLTILFSLILILKVRAEPMVPCFFIFGDSLFDAGNNNALNTKAKVNYKPYGIDYPGSRWTGRFTNGRTTVDVIAEHLGFKQHIQPFATAKGAQILNGVNYASGSSGIRRETGSHLGQCIGLEMQMSNHKRTIARLKPMLNNTLSAEEYLSKCIYAINIGSNDYINNYFMPQFYSTSLIHYTPDLYADALIKQYSTQLQALYDSGARKIAVYGLGAIGCTLAEVARRPKLVVMNPKLGPCVKIINMAVNLFNTRLKSLIPQLNQQFPDAAFTFINSEAIFAGPGQGIQRVTKPCCDVRDDFQCKPGVAACRDRKIFYFFDGFHPTEAVNKITGAVSFKAQKYQAFPYDISTLAKLETTKSSPY